MQIIMNIDAGQLGETVLDVFKSLTPEQKNTLAVQVLQEWLKDPVPYEAPGMDKQAIAYARNQSNWDRDRPDEFFRGTGAYKQYLADNNSKKAMVVAVQQEVIRAYQNTVKELVQTDPQIQTMKEAVVEVVKDAFPRMVHEAMVLWCASNLDRAVNAAVTGLVGRWQSTNDGSGQEMVPSLPDVVSSKLQEIAQQRKVAEVAKSCDGGR